MVNLKTMNVLFWEIYLQMIDFPANQQTFGMIQFAVIMFVNMIKL